MFGLGKLIEKAQWAIYAKVQEVKGILAEEKGLTYLEKLVILGIMVIIIGGTVFAAWGGGQGLIPTWWNRLITNYFPQNL